MIIQIITGTYIASYYTPDIDGAFGSIANLIREENYGWLIHAIHANGASMLFIAMYIHIFRSLSITAHTKALERFCGGSASSSFC